MTIQRRRWLLAQWAGPLLAVRRAWSQTPSLPRRIGVFALTENYTRFDEWRAFADEMTRRGYREGHEVVYIHRAPGTDAEPELSRRLPQTAQELVRLGVDLIYIVDSDLALRSTLLATQTIPIVVDRFYFDPVEAGTIASLSRPGGNATGNAVLGEQQEAKAIDLLLQAVGRVPKIGFLDPGHLRSWSLYQRLLARRRSLTHSMGVGIAIDTVDSFEQLGPALERLRAAGARAVKFDDPEFFVDRRAEVAAVFTSQRVPAVSIEPAYARAGLLMSFGWDVEDIARRSAAYADRILRGRRPQDLPVEQASKFKLAVNLTTARAIGVRLPPAILVRADEVIE